jgi:hypothetical protein
VPIFLGPDEAFGADVRLVGPEARRTRRAVWALALALAGVLALAAVL